MSSKKIYCYVDETGQDTEGDIFVVSVVVPENRDEVLEYLEKIEKESGKGKFKWGRTEIQKRIQYLETIFKQRRYPLKIYYSLYEETKGYKVATILTIAKAALSIKDFKEHKFIISVDGLSKKDQRFYGSELHKLGVPSREVKGVRKDEGNALIRLADSICGFVRDIIEEKDKDKKLNSLYKKAIEDKILIEV